MRRMLPYGKLDFTGKIVGNLYWKFGYHFKYFILDEFENENTKTLEYGKTLFGWYKDLGMIAPDEHKGGMSSAWRAGLCFDTRDVENAPTRGIWADAFMEWAPKWMGTNKPYGRYYAVLRQYIPFMKNGNLVFAYRASVQGFIGNPAFYMLPFESVLGPGYDRDGFGGYRTIRGIMRNRIQGKAICYFNTELRWRFATVTVLKQELTFGANAFFDGGRVLQNYSFTEPKSGYPDFLTQKGVEKFHLAAGGGLRFILNKNFIIAVDYGRAFNRQDNGKGGSLYINTGYLF
jgi:outer membrane protein assembly factor BamA